MMDEIQKIYIALFGRPADPLGLSFWMQQTAAGSDLAAFDGMTATREYLARFEGQANAEIVAAIYEALFNRVADEAGLRFFVEQLEKGTQTLSSIAIAIAQSAQNADASIIHNKIIAANLFTAALQSEGGTADYSGEKAADLARLFLKAVTASPGSLPGAEDAKHVLNPRPDVPVQPRPPVEPQPEPEHEPQPTHSLTLTAGQDYATSLVAYLNGPTHTENAFRFSAGDETVTATHLTMGVGDVLTDDSMDDRDVLNITVAPDTLNWVRDALVTNIEVLNAYVSAPTNDDALNLQNFRGLKEFVLHAQYAQTTNYIDYIYVHNFASSGVTWIDYSHISAGVNGEDYMYAEDAAAHQSITFVGHDGGDIVTFGDGDNAITTFGGVDIITVGNGDNVIDSGNDWDFVTVGSGSNLIITGGGVDEIKVGRPGEFGSSTIRPGALGDKVFLNGEGIYTIEVAKFDTGLALGDADKITGFKTGIDKIYFADLPSGTATNYQEAAQPLPGSDHAGALAHANGMFGAAPGTLHYFLINDAHHAYLFINDEGDGYADRMIAFAGLTTNDLAFSDLT